MFFTEANVPFEAVRKLDVNGDTLADVKLLIPYMGNGLASLNTRVIYLFQKRTGMFTKVSYLDKLGAQITEHDFDGDGSYEILTRTLKFYERHSYWIFNIYNFKDDELINQNDRFDYPIMVQYLFRENYRVTDKISAAKMKTFEDHVPEEYSRNQ